MNFIKYLKCCISKAGVTIPWLWVLVGIGFGLVFFSYKFLINLQDAESRLQKSLNDTKARKEITNAVKEEIEQEVRFRYQDTTLYQRIQKLEEKAKWDEYIDAKVQEATLKLNEKYDFWAEWGIPVTLIALVSALLAIYSRINPTIDAMLKEKVEARIKNLDERLEQNQESFDQIINQQNTLNLIKKNRRLLAISENVDNENKVREFFKNLGFKVDYETVSNQEFETYHNMNPKPESGCVADLLRSLKEKDLIIFDDRDYIPKKDENDKSLSNPRDKYIEVILENLDSKDANQKTFFVYFGANSSAINQRRDIAQAANSEITLYSRTQEALVYQNEFNLYKNK